MTYLVSLGTAVPAHAHAQETILEFMQALVPLPPLEQDRLAKMYARSGIQTRHSVIPDYGCPPQERRLYPPTQNLEPFPGLNQRMACFHQEALPLALNAVETCLERSSELKREKITHLIAITCTGLSAPGLDLMLLKELGLSPSTQRTGVHFMGCYAALHGLKMADAICRSQPDAVVLMVSVELCTLHFQKDPSPDNLAANLLFADGAAAALLCGAQARPAAPVLKLQNTASAVALEGWSDMAWDLSESGFLMRLSAYIPELLRQGISPLVERALETLSLRPQDIQHWAIHPGGRKILDVSEAVLAIPTLQASREILAEYGNMSSPTVLFVLDRLWQRYLDWSTPEHILAAAFGPGLTLETALFTSEP
ncbi:naringenin-chalcone synthase [bacterium (Candidatus Blackallbacteria) CG17_big_fil_post_rev_8_21_14_2_50_48_46]|uniref:Naringenin-chalcone synthase n=1 Tax=bacterium (Candidatus Blackallbacteria) CG17_big_fil_post_rev_8_21_14_2_50_48_46 TaxID=2014261 RepID=A0A2M7G742_9BACT|nr:MAG: naringenin-chalcone synthase [bacterium (Candidatus Blackallbacteria) CG18_big_fil_WC_8_21_14_2_50_49_26]PIW17880.1 MAG: naringenin-chalcone synthase [bacterium (Candidatus Blackallbacteria) CG17_big_fil_post_rev_8_21_14_2_50_48_46]PIW48556.1 MAG: naringenin-chalcone synthase [bacterium (Candidatus Blackallbacteria) CG13_big_fil_rev_8_21_14_2_50_49_14]